jgi:hypothetical protein
LLYARLSVHASPPHAFGAAAAVHR